MKKAFFKTISAALLLATFALLLQSNASNGYDHASHGHMYAFTSSPDTLSSESQNFPVKPKGKESHFATLEGRDTTTLTLKKPSNLSSEVVYDALTGEYLITEKAGEVDIKLPGALSLHDYLQADLKSSIDAYWRKKMASQSLDHRNAIIPQFQIGGDAFNKVFGSSVVNIRPQGYVEMSMGLKSNKIENPAIPTRMQRNTTFDFNQKINVSLDGQIGDRMQMRFNYNTDATFDFENKIKLNYTGSEDEILRNVEAGNVSMPLSGTLIRGGTNLFGVKTDLQFGKLSVSTLFSQQKGETKVINTQGGAQQTKFEINATDYDANRNFFLGHYFYDTYDQALSELPILKTAVTLNKIEVWVTNKSAKFQDSRNILAVMDMGENAANMQNQTIPEFGNTPGLTYPLNTLPNNGINGIYNQITTQYPAIRDISRLTETLQPLSVRDFLAGRDYEKIENARRLDSSEYTVNRQLGYISLNMALNADEVLAVAYQYTANGQTFQVGEFSTDGIEAPNTLVLKMLKGTNLNPKFKNWDLMMKNIYLIRSQRLSSDGFRMDVLFRNDASGTDLNYLPDGPLKEKILLREMNLDNLNSQLDPNPDGLFDFVEKITIDSQKGRIIFPVVQPFGSNLQKKLGGDAAAIRKYVYTSLYNSTKTIAEQDAEKNKYHLKGSYKGLSSSEISLDAINIARGSVKVMAGGRQLTEDVDYIVDYTQGRVKVINQGLLESGTPISISTESQDLFTMQRKTMLGTHLNYEISKNFNIGSTLMHLLEKPLTQKVNYGEDPISNTMLGFNGSYRASSPFITKMVNALPFLNTKEESKIAIEMEWAKLFPGHSKAISREGAVYLDDFEGTITPINLKSFVGWSIASTPQGNDQFPEGNLINDLAYGYNRALLSWYIIDPFMQRNTAPGYLLQQNLLDDHRVREVFQAEIFPNRQNPIGQPTNIPTLDLAFYPSERGPYNFDVNPNTYSAGVNKDGSLARPESRWGGIMRKIETSDFEATNVEYIEFWMMDPFAEDKQGEENPGGNLTFHLGTVSEDILRDGRKSFEHGLPANGDYTNLDITTWGRVSRQQSLVKAFDNSPTARVFQDIGLDGLNSTDEKQFYRNFLASLLPMVDAAAYAKAQQDPSSDDFHYFRGTDYDQEQKDLLERYKYFGNPEGNSPTNEQSKESYPTAATSIPDVEDINDDNTLNENESYFQYDLKIDRANMVLGKNYITDVKTSEVTLKSGKKSNITWYQFKVPIAEPGKTIGTISDFRSIRFMRMLMNGWKKPVVLRFATLDLVRTNWRRYDKSLNNDGSASSPSTQFDISAVNIEENNNRKPINYVLPPGVDRVIDPANAQLRQLNEQSMVLKVSDLEPGEAKAAYKTTSFDLRRYKNLKLEVHAEKLDGAPLRDNELSLFVRMGSDFQYNYYEYEIPLKLTPPAYYDNNRETDRYVVWPEENRVYIPLDLLPQLKLERNSDMHAPGSTLTMGTIYEQIHQGVNNNQNKIKIKGNPDLSEISVLMIGIGNRKGHTTGQRSAEVWVNEMRLTNFEEKGGWAAIGRVSGNLADLGTYSFAGRMMTSGFGDIDSKMSTRSKEDTREYDISTNLELGKFFKPESGVRIPMYLSFSKLVATPEYSPVDKDVKLKDELDRAASKSARDSIKKSSQEFTSRKSINFTNVQIDKPNRDRDTRFYDLSNLSLTYSWNQYQHGDVNTQLERTINSRTLLNYHFSSKPITFDPFKSVKFLQTKSLALIKDINFSLAPSQFSFRSDMNNMKSDLQYRNITNPSFILPLSQQRDFTWNRYYDLRWDLTRTLKLDFSAVNASRIGDPNYLANQNRDGYEARRDTIWKSILEGGRNTHYHHTWNLNYSIPINKLPLLDWTSSTATYQAGYDWNLAPVTRGSYEIGNSVSNMRSLQVSGQLDFLSLYNKIPYLRSVNQKYGEFSRGRRDVMDNRRPTPGLTQNGKATKYQEQNVRLKKNAPYSFFHRLGSTALQVKITDKGGKAIPGQVKVVNDNRIIFTPLMDCDAALAEITAKKEADPFSVARLGEMTARLLMMVYNLNVSYTTSGGTALFGYLPGSSLFGLNNFATGGGTSLAPGLPFILGHQDEGFGLRAAKNNWLTKDTIVNKPYTMSQNTRLMIRAKIVPIPDLKIELTANRLFAKNSSEFFLYNAANGWDSYNGSFNGNFSMSVLTLGTSFEKLGKAFVQGSKGWDDFRSNRLIIAQRLDAQRVANGDYNYRPGEIDQDTKFPVGYGPTSQEVLIPAFFAAYTGKSAEKVELTAFPSARFMFPNWRVQYSGVVNKIAGLKNIMKSMNILHDYRSTYNVGQYQSNLNYETAADGFGYVRDAHNNFLPMRDIAAININETFNPLFDVDITWLNNLTTRFEYRKTRNISLSLTNNQTTEMYNNEASVGIGYRFDNMKLLLKTKSNSKLVNNDLNIRADLTYGKNKTVLRKLVEENDQLTAGQDALSIKFSADYNLSEVFIVRLFYDRIVNSPYISNAYRTTNSNIGVSFRFTLIP
ncbi:MAG: cell surface protein SprA [Marinilabiliales bacterium]|nr:cell surface protein SprA [Marinilabiliales bacterium]